MSSLDIDFLIAEGQWDGMTCEFCDLPIALHWQEPNGGAFRCANANAHPPMTKAELDVLRKDVRT